MAPLVLAAALLLAAASPPSPTDTPHAVRLAPGRVLRVHTDAQQVLQGTLVRAEPGVLRLREPEGALREVPLAAVQRLEVSRSTTAARALWVGIPMAWTFGGLATYGCALSNAIGESGQHSSVPRCTLLGLASGAVTGALIGALTGLGEESWSPVHARGDAPLQLGYGAPESSPSVDRRRAELGLGTSLLVDTNARGESVGGVRFHAHLLTPVTERLALGPEGSLGGIETHQDLLGLGMRGRLWLGAPGGALRPLLSAVVGLEHFTAEDRPDFFEREVRTQLAAAVGGGIDWMPIPGAPGLTLEALWHQGLADEAPRASYLELGLTGALRF